MPRETVARTLHVSSHAPGLPRVTPVRTRLSQLKASPGLPGDPTPAGGATHPTFANSESPPEAQFPPQLLDLLHQVKEEADGARIHPAHMEEIIHAP